MNTLITIVVTFLPGWAQALEPALRDLAESSNKPYAHYVLGMDPYMAVGIALSSDVLASAVSAYTYGKNKNLDVKTGS